jgi:para-nitrobenzyl esterase
VTIPFYLLSLTLGVFCGSFLIGCGSSGSPSSPAPSIVTRSLPDGTIGTAYSQTLQLSGGSAPFVWSTSSGNLPNNLILASTTGSTATISGMPDRVQSNVAFSVTVTDAIQRSTTQQFTVSIAATPTVAVTTYGALHGVITGNLIAFRGVRYAAPPVGELRWKAPQPPASWEGVLDASKFGSVCPQINGSEQYAGNEDCLVLNVFVSQTPPSQHQPVIVFVHGGGNVRGDTQSDPTPLDAPPLANQGVVLVTIEYRLGALGWLSHPLLTEEGGGNSGNYALLDIMAALSWVHQNIAAFGGDPTRVMLFGQSAGSFDVEMLLAAPSAQGLFSAAGMESGTLLLGQLNSFAVSQAGGPVFAAAVGCGAAVDVLGCLRAVPVEVLVDASNSYETGPGIGSPFLPLDPFTVLQQQGSPVPLLIGSNREEQSLADDPNAQMDDAAYIAAIHQRFDPYGATVADQVLSLYPASAYSTPAYALIAVDSDFRETCEARSLARAAAAPDHMPVWRYVYAHAFGNDPSLAPYGAFHTAELFFVFGNFNNSQKPGGGIVYTPTTADLAFSQTLMGYWTRFNASGNPNGAGAVTWPLYDLTRDSMLQLDDAPLMINGYHNAQCDYLLTLL